MEIKKKRKFFLQFSFLFSLRTPALYFQDLAEKTKSTAIFGLLYFLDHVVQCLWSTTCMKPGKIDQINLLPSQAPEEARWRTALIPMLQVA